MNLMAAIGPRQCFGWAKEELSGVARKTVRQEGVEQAIGVGAIL
jgi:hypothetical protein